MLYTCPVCAYPNIPDAPYSTSGTASLEYCPCCGFQFGVTDNDKDISYEAWREHWIALGMPWNSRGRQPPLEWDPTSQLRNIIWTTVPSFGTVRLSRAEDRLGLWILASPRLREKTDVLVSFVTDLLDIVRPYSIETIETDEPRYYRDSLDGRAALTEAIYLRNVSRIDIRPDLHLRSHNTRTILMGMINPIETASVINVSISPDTENPIRVPTDQCIDLIHRWFNQLGAVSAGLRHAACGAGAEGGLYLTQRERERGRIKEWQAAKRFYRGTYWGIALGHDLCLRLGGQQRVLREAPAVIRKPLGDGVWLQISSSVPADKVALERMASYLAPLQNWTLADVSADTFARKALPSDSVLDDSSAQTLVSDADCGETGLPSPESGTRKMVPIEMLAETLTTFDMGLNVHVADPPSKEKLTALINVVDSWFRAGRAGAFTDQDPSPPYVVPVYPYVFRTLRGPSITDNVVRWYVHQGLADRDRALQDLSARLASLRGVEVSRLVVGTETVG